MRRRIEDDLVDLMMKSDLRSAESAIMSLRERGEMLRHSTCGVETPATPTRLPIHPNGETRQLSLKPSIIRTMADIPNRPAIPSLKLNDGQYKHSKLS